MLSCLWDDAYKITFAAITLQWRIQQIHFILYIYFLLGGGGGGVHEMRLYAKGSVGSFGGRKLRYNKIITRKM